MGKKLETDCQAVFEKFSLEGTGVDYGVEATIYTLTKGHPKNGKKIANPGAIPVTYKYVEFRSDEYYELKKKGIFPPAPIDDHHLMAGGIAGGFPDGRCTYELATPDDARRMRIYVNEEDHMRIQGMNKSGKDIGKEFKDFAKMIFKLEETFKGYASPNFGGAGALAFARNDTMGYLASCPSNNGTGMRVSAQLGFPNLVKQTASKLNVEFDPEMGDIIGDKAAEKNKEHGVEILEAINKLPALKENRVQVRGKGGEGTAPGTANCIVDMSYKLRTFVTEADIAQKLIESVSVMYKLEAEGLPNGGDNAPADDSGGWQFKIDKATWASVDCKVIPECKFSFDAKAPGARMLSQEEANKIYKKWVGAKTMYCHNICSYKGVTGLATLLAEDNGLKFTTTDAIWDFLEAEKSSQCRMCVGKFTGSLSSSVLTCSGGLAEHG